MKRLPADRAARLRKRILDIIAAERRQAPNNSVTIRAGDKTWSKLGPKMEMKLLHGDQDAGTQSYLLRLHPGAELQPHDRLLDEECLVLEGQVTLGPVTLRAGDFHFAPSGTSHGKAHSRAGALLFIRGAAPIP